MGAATLYQCALRGLKAVGFDQYAPPHDRGSSHGDTRITRLAIGEGREYVPFVQASHRIWRDLETRTGRTLLTQCGALVIASNGGRNSHHGKADFVTRTRATAESCGIAHEFLSASQIRSRFPYLVGLKGDEVAYYEAEGGFVRPEAAISAQLDVARRLGAEIHERTEILDIEGADGVGYDIRSEAGSVNADKVVVCAGAWTQKLLGDRFPGVLSVTRQVLHWFEVDDAVVPADSPVLIWMHGADDADYFYAFPPQPGEGAMKFATEQYERETTADDVARSVSAVESVDMFETHVRGRVSGVSGVVAKSAACLYTSTPDRGFILDALPSDPGIFVVSACSGHGFKHSAGIGEAIAERLAGERSRYDLSPFSLKRFLQGDVPVPQRKKQT